MNRIKFFFALICSVISFPVFGQNITRPNITGPGGVKVNSYTGNMFYQRTDLFLAGRIPIDISFSYNSADWNKNSGYGRGWTFNYGMQVKEDSASVTVTRNDGRKDIFKPGTGNPDLFIAPAGIFDSLIKASPGVYLLRTKDGTKYFFNNSVHKRLTRIENRNGNALVFSYTDSLVSGIADDAGRSIQLNYSNGRLASIIDANGPPTRTYAYLYDNSGNLLKMTDPMGYTTEYGNLINGPVNIVKDKSGNVVDVVYNGGFTVKEIISCVTKLTITYGVSTNTTHVTELVGNTNQLTSYKFDANGNLVQKTNSGYTIKYEYDQDKNISKLTDANGKSYTYTYDARGNMLSQTDPLGHTAHYAFEPVYNHVINMTDKNGNSASYAYDLKGNLTQVTRPLNISETYSYAANGDLTGYTDGRSNSISFTYDIYGNRTAINRPLGANIAYTYDAKGRRLTITDPLNHTTGLAYDSLDRILSVTDALNHQSSYTYDRNGNILTVTDANNHTTVNAYDASDRLVKITNALGKSKRIGYDAKNMITSIIDENGNTTAFAYDQLSRLISKTNAAGETTSYSYDGNGNIISIIYPNGNNVSLSYDGINSLTHSSDAKGGITTCTYDNNGNKLTETDGNGNAITYSYDALNRLTSITDALGHSSTYTYDQNSNKLSFTDRNSKSILDVYDALNRKTSTTDPLNHTTTFAYDAASNLTSVTDANSHATSYSYDALNRNTVETYADATSKTFTYDAVGNILTRLDGNGVTTAYSYDAVNRLILRNYPGINDDAYTYDDAGRMLTANNSDATITFAYDAADRPISETLNGKTTGYSYDIPGRKRTLHYPGGRAIVEIYDERNRLAKVNEGTSVIAGFTYDVANRNTSLNYLNGTSATISFDANNRIISMLSSPGGFQNFNYAYDNEGNKLFEKKIHHPASSEQYGHDNVNRLTDFKLGTLTGSSVPAPLTQTQYNYDGVGNRNTINVNGVLTTYTANNINAYTGTSGGNTAVYTHDNNGNLTFDGTNNYSYDSENRLVAANSSALASYKYDASGRRIIKTTAGAETHYYYTGHDIIEERNANDSVLATYVFGSKIDDALTMNRNNTNYFYHYNNLGSVTSVTNGVGQVVERYQYDPFGKVFLFNANYDSISSSSINNSIYYTGRTYDKEIDKYYYRARHYDASTGRFLQRDPIGYVGGDMNLYSYVKNMPTGMIDPLGTNPYDQRERSKREPNLNLEPRSPGVYDNMIDPSELAQSSHDGRNQKTDNGKLLDNVNDGIVTPAADILEETGKFQKAGNILSHASTGLGLLSTAHSYDVYYDDPTPGHLVDVAGNAGSLYGGPFGLIWDLASLDLLLYNLLHGTKYSLGEIFIDDPTIGFGIVYDGFKRVNSFNPVLVGERLSHDLFTGGSGRGSGSIGSGGNNTLTGGSSGTSGPTFSIPIIRSVDPNEIQGPAGVLTKKWMAAKDVFGYTVRFENDPDFATGPAQKVVVTVPIDSTFDINSLRLGNFGFGSMFFNVPPNSPTYYARLDLRDSLGLFVDVLAGINITNHEAIWVFQSIDPATGEEPTDPTVGFLPLRDTSATAFSDSIPNQGEGFVSYSVLPAATVNTGDSTQAQASIIFDENAPVLTNIEKNTIDAVEPASFINALPGSVNTEFTLSWTGNDDPLGSGIKNYELYVSKNNGAFALEQANIDSSFHHFVGEPGATYSFYTLATDNTGNKEVLKTSGDVTVTVLILTNSICPGISHYFAMPKPGEGYTYQWQIDSTGNGFVNLLSNAVHTGTATDTLLLNTPPTSYYGYKYRCIATKGSSAVYSAGFVLKFGVSWEGNTNTAWENPANWNCNIVPDEFTDVIIPGALTTNPVVNANTACRSILISAGSILTVNPGIKLDIKGK